MSDEQHPQEFYKELEARFVAYTNDLINDQFGEGYVPLVISMMSTEDYVEKVASSMVLGYLEALKDGFALEQLNGVWAVVSYDYYAYVTSVHPNKEAAMAAKTDNESVGFLPFGEGNTYFGMEDARENLEVQ